MNRDRADLFSRVEKRVGERQDVLETHATALTVSTKRVSTQCENLIQEVRTG